MKPVVGGPIKRTTLCSSAIWLPVQEAIVRVTVRKTSDSVALFDIARKESNTTNITHTVICVGRVGGMQTNLYEQSCLELLAVVLTLCICSFGWVGGAVSSHMTDKFTR